MKEKHVLYLVKSLVGNQIRVDGGGEIDSSRRPDASITVRDTIYHVHLKATSYRVLDEATRREAIKSVTKRLQAAHEDSP